MKFTIEKIERFESKSFCWYEAQLALNDGTSLQAFFDTGDGAFRLFRAEHLSWAERDSIRDQIMKVLCAMLAAECEDKD